MLSVLYIVWWQPTRLVLVCMSLHHAAHTQADALIDMAGRECWQHATLNSACVPLDKKQVSDTFRLNEDRIAGRYTHFWTDSPLAIPVLSKYSIKKTDLTLSTVQNNWSYIQSSYGLVFELRNARTRQMKSSTLRARDVMCCLFKAIAHLSQRWQMNMMQW